MRQDDVMVSCACERGHLWDVSITACSLAEGGSDVKDALDEGAIIGVLWEAGAAICAGGTAARRDLWRGKAGRSSSLPGMCDTTRGARRALQPANAPQSASRCRGAHSCRGTTPVENCAWSVLAAKERS